MTQLIQTMPDKVGNCITDGPSGRCCYGVAGADFMRIFDELFWRYLCTVGLVDRVQFLTSLKHCCSLRQSTKSRDGKPHNSSCDKTVTSCHYYNDCCTLDSMIIHWRTSIYTIMCDQTVSHLHIPISHTCTLMCFTPTHCFTCASHNTPQCTTPWHPTWHTCTLMCFTPTHCFTCTSHNTPQCNLPTEIRRRGTTFEYYRCYL